AALLPGACSPPTQPWRPRSVARAPARAAASAADKPPGPLPTTSTSVSWTTSTDRAGSLIWWGSGRPGRQLATANAGVGSTVTATDAPGYSPLASEADIWATTSVSSGSVTWARHSDPRKLTAATRPAPSTAAAHL